jgi:membrane protein DedA with SNARE-associated domain
MDNVIDIIRRFIIDWGYWGVAAGLLLENAGIPVPGETILILASVVAYNTHELHLPWIIVIGTIAATIGDNIGYWIGRKGGRPLLERWKRFFHVQQKHIAAGEALIHKHGAVAIFLARFITGARVIAGPLAGVLQMDWPRFALFNFLGAITWVSVIACIAFAFGSQLDRLLAYMEEANYIILIAIAVLILFFLLRRRWRKAKT